MCVQSDIITSVVEQFRETRSIDLGVDAVGHRKPHVVASDDDGDDGDDALSRNCPKPWQREFLFIRLREILAGISALGSG